MTRRWSRLGGPSWSCSPVIWLLGVRAISDGEPRRSRSGARPDPCRRGRGRLLDDLGSAHTDNDPLYAVWVLILGLGLRKGEVLGLTWPTVDLAAAEVSLE